VLTRRPYSFDPLRDPRWAALVETHPSSSVFHTTAWLEALRRAYRFEPVVWTDCEPGQPLTNGLLFCAVRSWLTGNRLISLPFSDHCEALSSPDPAEPEWQASLAAPLSREPWRYIEFRTRQPFPAPPGACHSTQEFCFHELDLRPPLPQLFAQFHKSSTQRKIQRAEREGLRYECGRSPALLNAFWDLLLLTRRRHGVPPQPRAWFENLLAAFGDAVAIRVAFQDRKPAAAILTLRHRRTLVYKYGCSDATLNHLGGTQWLFWRAIQEASDQGLEAFDLGRSDLDAPGLITFKDRLGAAPSRLTYTRLSRSPAGGFHPATNSRGIQFRKQLLKSLPAPALRMAGRMLYRHIA
jgi:CelD/BcsL family acetyltransferase involved in cellulose biosynthesis